MGSRRYSYTILLRKPLCTIVAHEFNCLWIMSLFYHLHSSRGQTFLCFIYLFFCYFKFNLFSSIFHAAFLYFFLPHWWYSACENWETYHWTILCKNKFEHTWWRRRSFFWITYPEQSSSSSVEIVLGVHIFQQWLRIWIFGCIRLERKGKEEKW